MTPSSKSSPQLALWHYFIGFSLFFLVGWLFLSWLQGIFPDNYWPLGVDVYPLWSGTSAFWQGETPYSAAVDTVTQGYVYGRMSVAGEDTFSYYYPAYTSVVLAPFALLPAPTAAILWPALMWAVLGVLAMTTIELMPPRKTPWLWAVLLLSLFLFRPALLTLLNGQYGLFTMGLWGIVWWLVQRQKDGRAGFLLALATIKLSLGLLPALLLILWAVARRRHKLVIGFAAAMGGLLLISFMQIGWWLPEFLAQLAKYNRDLGTWKPADAVTLPGLIWLVEALVLIVLGIRQAVQHKDDFPATLFWGGIFLNMLLTPHTLEYDLVVVLLPLLGHIPRYFKSSRGTAIWLLLFWLPWLSWLLLLTVGVPTQVWWRAIWLFYPQVLLAALIVTAVTPLPIGPKPPRF